METIQSNNSGLESDLSGKLLYK